MRANAVLTGRSPLLVLLLVSAVAVAAVPAPTAMQTDEEQSEFIMILEPDKLDVNYLKQTCDALATTDSTVRLSAPWQDGSWRWYVFPPAYALIDAWCLLSLSLVL